jgi:plasmid maintenance system killer protein
MIAGFRDHWLREFFLNDKRPKQLPPIWKEFCFENCS